MPNCKVNIVINEFCEKSTGNGTEAQWGSGNELCYEGTLYDFLYGTQYHNSKFYQTISDTYYNNIHVTVSGSPFLARYLQKRCQGLSNIEIQLESSNRDASWFQKAFKILESKKNTEKFYFCQIANGTYSIEQILGNQTQYSTLFSKLFSPEELTLQAFLDKLKLEQNKRQPKGKEGEKKVASPFLSLISREQWNEIQDKSLFSFGLAHPDQEAGIVDNVAYCHWNLEQGEFQRTLQEYLVDNFILPYFAKEYDEKALKNSMGFDSIQEVLDLLAFKADAKRYLVVIEDDIVIVGKNTSIPLYQIEYGSIQLGEIPSKNAVVIRNKDSKDECPPLDVTFEKGKIIVGTKQYELFKKRFILSFENWKAPLFILTKKKEGKFLLADNKKSQNFELTVRGDGSIEKCLVDYLDGSMKYLIDLGDESIVKVTTVYYDTTFWTSKGKDESYKPERIVVYKNGEPVKTAFPSEEEIKQLADGDTPGSKIFNFEVDFKCNQIGFYPIEIKGESSGKTFLQFILEVRDPDAVANDLIIDVDVDNPGRRDDPTLAGEKLHVSRSGNVITVSYPPNVTLINFMPKYVRTGHEDELYEGPVQINGKTFETNQWLPLIPLSEKNIQTVTSSPDILKKKVVLKIVFKKRMHPCLVFMLVGFGWAIANFFIHGFLWYGLSLLLLLCYAVPLALNLYYFLRFPKKLYSKEQLLSNCACGISTIASMLIIWSALLEEMH